jgi:hypothetical protein
VTDGRTPGAAPAGGVTPAALHGRVAEALGAAGVASAAQPSPSQCLAAGEHLLERALAGDERSRATALDLLAADALVTRAFELAATGRDDLERLADAAMRRIAAHAAGTGDAAP